jgi:hypothetical protein
MGEILVGVDGSANSAAALRWALAEAELRHHHVTALFAWGYIRPGHAGDGHTLDADYGTAEADTCLAAAIQAAVGPGAATGIDRRVVRDPPATPTATSRSTRWWCGPERSPSYTGASAPRSAPLSPM